jgi:hypothetical protein
MKNYMTILALKARFKNAIPEGSSRLRLQDFKTIDT